MPSTLFTPFALGPVELPNRIVVAPMCQYSAHDGVPGDWHLPHYLSLALGGAGLVVFEATHVERRGRITHGCLGLYNDAQEIALTALLARLRQAAPPGTRFGIQLAHAGRKASAQRPWEGGRALQPGQDPWATVGASALPFAEGWHTPAELDAAGLAQVRDAFVQAAERAVRIGFDVVELHAAHGYLLHAFLSPLANHRSDAYGGSAEARLRFPVEVATAVRAALPPHVALGARISGSDYADGGITVDEAVTHAAALKAAGAVFVCVSGGGHVARPNVHPEPGYQVPMAARIREGAAIATRAVGLIVDPQQAERIVATGDADLVALARAFLDNPRWGWHAAQVLGAPEPPRPQQYARASPSLWSGAAQAHPGAARAATPKRPAGGHKSR